MDNNIQQTIGEVKATAKAAHDRIDKLETGLREDLKEIAVKLGAIEAWMHTKKGYEAAVLLIASLIGGALTILANKFL